MRTRPALNMMRLSTKTTTPKIVCMQSVYKRAMIVSIDFNAVRHIMITGWYDVTI